MRMANQMSYLILAFIREAVRDYVVNAKDLDQHRLGIEAYRAVTIACLNVALTINGLGSGWDVVDVDLGGWASPVWAKLRPTA